MFYIDNETNTTDKYDMAIFLDFTDDGVFDPLNSYFMYEIPKLPTIGYHTVRTEEHRPDMLSFNIYGDTQYWWVLMWYNHMMKPQDIKVGVQVRYPSLSSLEQLYLNASLYQKVGQ